MSKVIERSHEITEKKVKKVKKVDKRAIFESNLKRLGLELEYASARVSLSRNVPINHHRLEELSLGLKITFFF